MQTRPILIALFILTLFGSLGWERLGEIPQTTALTRCAAPAVCGLAADESSREAAFLITTDVLLAAAQNAEKRALRDLETDYDRLQRTLIGQARDALIARFKTWKLDDPVVRQALTELMLEWATLSRFEKSDREFLLSFDRSVQSRISTFYRVISLGRSMPQQALPPLAPDAGPDSLARLYADVYPLDLATETGRRAAFLWMHLLHTEPELRRNWERLWMLADARWGERPEAWNLIEAALEGRPLARLEDLNNPETIHVLTTAIQAAWRPRTTETAPGVIQLPLALLPIPQATLGRLLTPVLNQPQTASLPLWRVLTADMEAWPLMLEAAGNTPEFMEMRCALTSFVADEQRRASWSPFFFTALPPGLGLGLWARADAPAVPPPTQPAALTNTYVEWAPQTFNAVADLLTQRAAHWRPQTATSTPDAISAAAAEVCLRWAEHFRRLADAPTEAARSALPFTALPESLAHDPDLLAVWHPNGPAARVLTLTPAGPNRFANARLAGSLWMAQQLDAEFPPLPPLVLPDGDEDDEIEMEREKPAPRLLRLYGARLIYGEGRRSMTAQGLTVLPPERLLPPSDLPLPPSTLRLPE